MPPRKRPIHRRFNQGDPSSSSSSSSTKRGASSPPPDVPLPKRQATATSDISTTTTTTTPPLPVSCNVCDFHATTQAGLTNHRTSRSHLFAVLDPLLDAVSTKPVEQLETSFDQAAAAMRSPLALFTSVARKNTHGLLHLAVLRRDQAVFDLVFHRLKLATDPFGAGVLEKAIDAHDGFGYTALHYSAFVGMQSLMERLLDHRADPNDRAYHKATALHFAASQGHDHLIELLVRSNADMDAVAPTLIHNELSLVSSLSVALIEGHQHTARRLVELGCQALVGEESSVRWCGILGLTDMIRQVFGPNGAPMNMNETDQARTRGRFSALMEAVNAGHLETTRALIEWKSNVNYSLSNHESALTLAAGQSIEFTRLLLEAGADARCEGGNLAFCDAFSNNDFERASILLQYGADINSLVRGSSVLQKAVYTCNLRALEFCIDHGADKNIVLVCCCCRRCCCCECDSARTHFNRLTATF